MSSSVWYHNGSGIREKRLAPADLTLKFRARGPDDH